MRVRLKTLIVCLLAGPLISACSLLKPYQAELGQGNFVRAEQIAQLEVGQTAQQVLFILGKPLLSGEDPSQRWIYTLFNEADGYRNLIINFEQGLVSEIIKPVVL